MEGKKGGKGQGKKGGKRRRKINEREEGKTGGLKGRGEGRD